MQTTPPASLYSKILHTPQGVFGVTLFFNLLVSLSKLFWGYQTHTLSMTADGFHSLLDAVANVVGIVGLNISMKPADHNHPYGHRKFEAIASMVISFFIFLTCFEIAGEGFSRFFSPQHSHPRISPTSYGIIGITLLINLWVTWYENKKGKELKSDLLIADAKHTLSDCLVSISVLFSMAAVQLGFLWADTVLALVVSLIILKVGFELIMIHFSALTDEAALDPNEISAVVLAVPGVLDCHKIRSRGMRDHVFIDLHIQVDPQLTVKEAHGISYRVESTLGEAFDGQVREVLVHVEEYEGTAESA
ncbi:cation diffusion facilitator family transporter [Vampirovibrio chlorellavorus]|uniref:cation diffusion facilitator family transporter n=1 Tax=Vampirovibrio chlorellavorus TaxID=758823 RepID=UPI0026F10D33|nr:cation diffusion facilitator family transporter [Vampirovibrio chlorellavorus]